MSTKSGLTYKDAGVDIDAGNALVERIKPLVAKTARPEVLNGIGGFGGLFALAANRYREPVLVSGTDGVGTKLLLARQLDRHDRIGQDLVAMCVNDIVVSGAEPLFFLDYFATGRLDQDVAAQVIGSIADGCSQAGCALIGGETAEMPGMYEGSHYDLAGFTVGVVERESMIDGSAIRRDDVLLGIASSGPHSNGYSLIRRVLERAGDGALELEIDGINLGQALMEPTQIYVKPILAAIRECEIRGLAHITGGGLHENILRVIPDGLGIDIDVKSWPRPAVFDWLAETGNIADEEMLRTFNCGVGMVAVIPSDEVRSCVDLLASMGLDSWPIGVVQRLNPVNS